METGSVDFINERLISSIGELKYQTICNQIMMESCTAILAQANQVPMSILKLLWVNQWIGTDSYSAGIPEWVWWWCFHISLESWRNSAVCSSWLVLFKKGPLWWAQPVQPTALNVTELMFVKIICPAIYKLLSVNPGMETGSAYFINGRLISSIWELN